MLKEAAVLFIQYDKKQLFSICDFRNNETLTHSHTENEKESTTLLTAFNIFVLLLIVFSLAIKCILFFFLILFLSISFSISRCFFSLRSFSLLVPKSVLIPRAATLRLNKRWHCLLTWRAENLLSLLFLVCVCVRFFLCWIRNIIELMRASRFLDYYKLFPICLTA